MSMIKRESVTDSQSVRQGLGTVLCCGMGCGASMVNLLVSVAGVHHASMWR